MDQWTSFKCALRVCLASKGIVYGGAIRDLFLHNINSREFFTTNTLEEYSDITVRPDTIDRLIIPKDIDCLISEKDSADLIRYFNRHYFLKIGEAYNEYFCRNTNYKHLKLCVLFHKSSLVYVKIDLIVQKDGVLQLPCSNLDFDVNGLLLTSNGIGLSEFLNETCADCVIKNADKLQMILDNIRQKKAVFIEGCPIFRYIKMHKYGWNIHFKAKVFNYYINEPYEGECIICKEKIPDDMCCVSYKACRCDLRICIRCILNNSTKLHKCPLCSEICYDTADAHHDLAILRIKYLPSYVE